MAEGQNRENAARKGRTTARDVWIAAVAAAAGIIGALGIQVLMHYYMREATLREERRGVYVQFLSNCNEYNVEGQHRLPQGVLTKEGANAYGLLELVAPKPILLLGRRVREGFRKATTFDANGDVILDKDGMSAAGSLMIELRGKMRADLDIEALPLGPLR